MEVGVHENHRQLVVGETREEGTRDLVGDRHQDWRSERRFGIAARRTVARGATDARAACSCAADAAATSLISTDATATSVIAADATAAGASATNGSVAGASATNGSVAGASATNTTVPRIFTTNAAVARFFAVAAAVASAFASASSSRISIGGSAHSARSAHASWSTRCTRSVSTFTALLALGAGVAPSPPTIVRRIFRFTDAQDPVARREDYEGQPNDRSAAHLTKHRH
jgi:hypothetical protein